MWLLNKLILFQNTLTRLCSLKITCSHTFLYKKLDQFGEDHNKHILESVKQQGEFMELQAERQKCDAGLLADQKNKCVVQGVGRKLVFDNIDYRQEVHYMTHEHQNNDAHCVTYMSVANHLEVSGNHLSHVRPGGSVLNLENGKCLPSVCDNVRQRENCIALIGRIISAKIKCLQFLQDVSVAHIPHLYRKEMSAKSNVVS